MADEQQVNTEESQVNTEEKPQQPEEAVSSNNESTDAGNAKAFGIIGYIIPILFFLPLVMEDSKNNPFAKFHANQQLTLLLYWVAINIIAIIPVLGWIVWFFGWIFGVVLAVMGIVNVSNDKQKELPLIGGISLLN